MPLETRVVDRAVYNNTARRFRDARILLPRVSQLAQPQTIPTSIRTALAEVDPDAPHPLNLFRVHWFNDTDRAGLRSVPDYLVLPPQLSGVEAKIVLLLGSRFPMIRAHKVLAAYGCLVPRIVTGQFDPTRHRAVWPSTGNYCRGGVAISTIMQCRGVAVLPEGMSRERFDWLRRWVSRADDIIRTPGSESNVKEIYDRCAEIDREPRNIIFNQFSEFGNHLAHYLVTGQACARVFETMRQEDPGLQLRAFVSASGSAGTLGAGDYLKEAYGSAIVGAEPLECPTMLYNGFGEHNIQGIGDKHIPLIHNVMNMDLVTAISDRATDTLNVLFNTDAGRQYLVRERAVSLEVIERLSCLGLSSVCNVLAAIKTAMLKHWGPNDVILTVATDGAELYETERDKFRERVYPHGFGQPEAAEAFERYLVAAKTDHLLELSQRDRERIFNLGYFTWVEQQGLSIEDFVKRRDPAFWIGLRPLIPAWDTMIDAFNATTGVQI